MIPEWPLPEELELLRDTVQRFASQEIAPRAAAIDSENLFPPDLWPMLGELGLLGMTVPAEFGGSELGYQAHLLAMEEISRASGSVGLSYGANTNLCSGEWVGALAMSEAGAGSDIVGSMACRAKWNGNAWVANGAKMWITNGPEAAVVVTYMKTTDPGTGEDAITAFLVEKGMHGFSTSTKLDKLGMRGSNTCELVFENCEIPPENVLGEPHQGVGIMMSGLDSERLVLSGGPIGLMQAALDLVVPYTRERKQFGKPIGELGVMQAKLAEMYTAMQSSRAFAYHVAQAFDNGRRSRIDPAACLLHASSNAVQVALEAIQSLGGNGYINDYPAGRILRDAKLYEIGAGTNEIRRMLIGRELFRSGA